MKSRLIIFSHGGGRLGNQLINMSHLYAFFLEHEDEFDIINMAFWPYAHLFEFSIDNRACLFSSNNHKHFSYLLLNDLFRKIMNENRRRLNPFIRLIHLYYSFSPFKQSILKGIAPNFLKYINGKTTPEFDLSSDLSLQYLRRKNSSVIAGWPVRCWDLFEKHEEQIRNFLQFAKKYTSISDLFFSKLRISYNKVIGVFIRRGDYKIWCEGKYFFDYSFYKRIMSEAAAFYSDKNVCFIIASDDPVDTAEFNPLNVFLTTGSITMGGSFVESLIELAECDFVMSPPSTFGIWAAFSGKKPLLPLVSSKQEFSADDFIYNNFFDALKHEHLAVSIK